PRWEALPKALCEYVASQVPDASPEERAALTVFQFCRRVLELVEPYARVVKLQSAFFELLGPNGMEVQQQLFREAELLDFVTVLDAKRGDIASPATAYADAAFGGFARDGRTYPVWDADALTINPYLGRDAVEPFLEAAKKDGRGVFVLVRTSNPGAVLFQD